jgi:hypothetical protein
MMMDRSASGACFAQARDDRKVIMGFLKKLFGGGTARPEKRFYVFHVKCNRCGEVIEGRVDLDNDLSLDYEGDSTVYFVRKGLIGDNRCFQQIEVEMKFSSQRELIERQAQGGIFVE